MSGGFLRNGGLRAHQLLISRRFPSHPLSNPSSRSYIRSNFFSSKLKDSPPVSSVSRLITPAVLPSCSSLSSSLSSLITRNGFIGWYLAMIEARPVLTKGITAGVIFTVADISSQMITLEPADSLDLIRTLRMAGYGMLISGPTLHLWFNSVSRFLPRRDTLTTFKKMFLGQTVYGPLMTAVFFSVNAALQGETAAEIFARLKRDLIPTLISGLVYWPMCDFVTFKFVPVRLQPLVSNSFSFLWTIYLTYMASLQKASIEASPAESSLSFQ